MFGEKDGLQSQDEEEVTEEYDMLVPERPGNNEENIYNEDTRQDMLAKDEIDSNEEAFMRGYEEN